MKIYSLVLLTLLFEGCDIGRGITLKTANKPNVSIIIYGNRPLRWTVENGDRPKITEQKIIHVPDMGKRKIDVMYGFGGGWTESMIAGYSSYIDSIIINSSKGTTKIKDSTTIFAYLLKHRGWLYTNMITIKVK